MPNEFGPWQNTYDRFRIWVGQGAFQQLMEALIAAAASDASPKPMPPRVARPARRPSVLWPPPSGMRPSSLTTEPPDGASAPSGPAPTPSRTTDGFASRSGENWLQGGSPWSRSPITYRLDGTNGCAPHAVACSMNRNASSDTGRPTPHDAEHGPRQSGPRTPDLENP
ncbi:hypothetical protein [Streptomyces sp. NRRL S-646]|uniref:hypothetical protein n=1 Tax=Streptomyces sp. NRRL S-646 TaxID=1463917 RepID=UPI003B6390D1